MPTIEELERGVNNILHDPKISNGEKRKRLNFIEKAHPQLIFIKTHLCSCGRMTVEVWIKHDQCVLGV